MHLPSPSLLGICCCCCCTAAEDDTTDLYIMWRDSVRLLWDGEILISASEMFTEMFPQSAASFTDVKRRPLTAQNAVYT